MSHKVLQAENRYYRENESTSTLLLIYIYAPDTAGPTAGNRRGGLEPAPSAQLLGCRGAGVPGYAGGDKDR